MDLLITKDMYDVAIPVLKVSFKSKNSRKIIKTFE